MNGKFETNLHVYSIEAPQEIHVEGQYGSSFKAKITRKSQSPDSIEKVELVKGVSLKTNAYYFIKCPSELLDKELQQQFVDREFESGTSINHVAERLTSRHGKNPFQITKMMGKGVLNYQSKKRPCLIYQYAGDEGVTNYSLATQWQELHVWKSREFLTFARGFARAVQVLHNQGIVHSFLVPRNIIMQKNQAKSLSVAQKNYWIVGFGYARHADAAARRTDTIHLQFGSKDIGEDQWYRAPECRSSHSHTVFGYASDIYSIGAILYSLLLDRRDIADSYNMGWDVLHSPPTDTRLLKKRISEAVKNKQPELLKDNENILKIIDSCLRSEAEDRFSCVEELIEAIDIAIAVDNISDEEQPANKPSNANLRPFDSDTLKKHINKYFAGKDEHKLPSYFAELGDSLLDNLAVSYGGLYRGHYEVYGHRDRIVTSLCRLLGRARKGDTYQTMTLPDYWTDSNLGSLGRFLTMNKHMARYGIKIKRLFLVSDHFHKLSEEEQVVLEDQLHALMDLENDQSGGEKNFEIRVYIEEGEKIADFERNGELVAFLAPQKKIEQENEDLSNTICLNFFSTAKEVWNNGRVTVKRAIKKVRYWSPTLIKRENQFQESRSRFDQDWQDAMSLRTFILGKSEPGTPEQKPSVPEDILLSKLLGKEAS